MIKGIWDTGTPLPYLVNVNGYQNSCFKGLLHTKVGAAVV